MYLLFITYYWLSIIYYLLFVMYYLLCMVIDRLSFIIYHYVVLAKRRVNKTSFWQNVVLAKRRFWYLTRRVSKTSF